jgi:hypothetical protein
VEDWEQFFAEKSRRRADKERSDRRRRRRNGQVTFILIMLALIGAFVALAVARQSALR